MSDEDDVLFPGRPDLVEIHPRDVRDLRPGDILVSRGTSSAPWPSSAPKPTMPGTRGVVTPTVSTVVNSNTATKGSSFASTVQTRPAVKPRVPNVVVKIIPTCVLCGEDLDETHPKYCENCLDDVTQYAKDASGI